MILIHSQFVSNVCFTLSSDWILIFEFRIALDDITALGWNGLMRLLAPPPRNLSSRQDRVVLLPLPDVVLLQKTCIFAAAGGYSAPIYTSYGYGCNYIFQRIFLFHLFFLHFLLWIMSWNYLVRSLRNVRWSPEC